MADFYLKFPDQTAADVALTAAGIASDCGATWHIDRLVTVWTDPVLDGAGDVVEAGVAVTGYHVNLRLLTGDLPSELTTFQMTPATPFRRFA